MSISIKSSVLNKFILNIGYKIKDLRNNRQPQFRSIIPCEVLLYIEVTFLDLSIDMGIFWGSWFLHSHEIPHPNQWGSMKNHKNDVYSRKTSE